MSSYVKPGNKKKNPKGVHIFPTMKSFVCKLCPHAEHGEDYFTVSRKEMMEHIETHHKEITEEVIKDIKWDEIYNFEVLPNGDFYEYEARRIKDIHAALIEFVDSPYKDIRSSIASWRATFEMLLDRNCYIQCTRPIEEHEFIKMEDMKAYLEGREQ